MAWHDAEQVEKIHEFSLPVQNSAKNQTDPASGRRMTVDFIFFIFYKKSIFIRVLFSFEMKKIIFFLTIITAGILTSGYVLYHENDRMEACAATCEDWGFVGHRLLNRYAVFTLPPEMMVFYKKNIEFITEHAVDPDKRRYATKYEAPRHYIDIDHWGEYPYENIPRRWTPALAKFTDVFIISNENDTIQLFGNEVSKLDDYKFTLYGEGIQKIFGKDSTIIYRDNYIEFVQKNIERNIYKDDKSLNAEDLLALFSQETPQIMPVSAYFDDQLSNYGIIPWHLQRMQKQLTNAFTEKDAEEIIRISADFGHYVGDAHVPLHTTTNYNGQLTNQLGIHAFWESRVLELFIDEYDTFVGKADYIDYPKDYVWDVVLASHVLVDSVLNVEKRLVRDFPKDRQMCFDERLDRTINTQCEEFARAFSEEMQGMVEQRFTEAIHALGSLWYTAWVDAGQPDLNKIGLNKKEKEAQKELKEELNKAANSGKIFGRQH